MAFRPIADMMIVEKWEDVASKIVTPDTSQPTQSDTFIVKEMGKGILLDDKTFYRPDIAPGDKVCIVGKILRIPVLYGEFLIARMSDVIAVEKEEKVEIPDSI